MPGVIKKKCPVCGGSHDFFILADLASDSAYEFTCPKGEVRGSVRFSNDADFSQIVQARPPGSVMATEAPSGR